MKIVAIVQARMGSTRLPGKVMKKINGVPLIQILLMRLSKAKTLDSIIVATSPQPENIPLTDFLHSAGFKFEYGSEDDVLDRYFKTARNCEADAVVRITADCPLIDPVIIDDVVNNFKENNSDYCSNINPRTFPDGLDVEIFSMKVLENAHRNASEPYDREHVTPFIRESNQVFQTSVTHSDDLSELRWTVDEKDDFEVIEKVFEHFSPNIYFNWKQVLELESSKPHIFNSNKHLKTIPSISTNEGQKLWRQAKRCIAGGNMLLSKKPDMFLPNKWPSYYKKSKDCRIWDLDNNVYVDMSIMGIGTNILGYSHPKINQAVIEAIQSSNSSTLNCPEEVYLAEQLLGMHPWADMARFARTGGEANAIAIRIARAAVGKDNVAVCGYHGWHDWYLSANHGSRDQLQCHLLPGLKPKGVPEGLQNTIFTFQYNDFQTLQSLVETKNIGVIKMEVRRNIEPQNEFLQKVRKLASDKNLVLIFDECTAGFRETFGGLHLKYGVYPDMAIFGKALGNGHAITAVIGIRNIMEEAQNTFISSTFWTERSGPVAALATLEEMEKIKSWEIITKIGHDIKSGWKHLADKHSLEIEQWGLPSLSGFTILSPHKMIYKTYITQELLKKGYLGANSVYACIAHNDTVLQNYFEELDPIFEKIKRCEDELYSVNDLLEDQVCESGFGRLN